MGTRGPKPQHVDTTWTPELAYVVGIFASDGNLGKDGMYLNVTSRDKIILSTVLRVLDREHIRIGRKSNGSGSYAHCVQLKSVVLHAWLVSIGLTPNKSKTIGALDVPDRYFFDFLRGVWDGDGSIYAFWDTRWRSSYVYHLEFTSGSSAFLHWVQNTTTRLVNVRGHIGASSAARAMYLRFAQKDSRTIFKQMFPRRDIPHLPRKFTKAQKIFKINERNAQRWGYQ